MTESNKEVQAQLTEEQRNAFSAFTSAMDLFVDEYSDVKVIANVRLDGVNSRYVNCDGIKQAFEISFADIMATLGEITKSRNEALVTLIGTSLNFVDVDEEDSVYLNLLHDINQFLATNEHAQEIMKED